MSTKLVDSSVVATGILASEGGDKDDDTCSSRVAFAYLGRDTDFSADTPAGRRRNEIHKDTVHLA